MSTTTPATPVTIDTQRPKVPFTRHVAVEVRKMFDTRAGLWLFIVTGGLLLFAMGITLLVLALNDDLRISANDFSQIMTIPISILIPVFAIFTITSEWSQRTSLVTFSLEPRRGLVLAAKLVAVTLLALGTIVVAIIAGAVGNLLYGVITGNDVIWNIDVSELIWAIVVQLAFFLMAFGIASVLLSTPAAVAVFYVVALILPMMIYPVLLGLFGWARDTLPWLDFNYAAAPLMSGTDIMGNTIDVGVVEYLRFAFTLFLWVILPNAIGATRVLRSEVK